jgi:hypothetical protein
MSDDNFSADALAEIAGDTGPSLGERVMAFAGHGDAKHISADVQDAAASEADAEGADLQGKPGDDADDSDGLDTDADEAGEGADPDEDEEADADETDQKEEEGKEKGTKKRTLDERVNELVEKRLNERLNALDKAKAEESPDFAGAEVIADVKRNIAKKLARIRELEADIDLEDDDADPKSVDELLSLHDFVAEARAALKENEAKKAAWEKRQGEKKAQTDSGEALRVEMDKAAELYREDQKIDKPTWDKMGKWFEGEIATKPLLVEEFNDIFTKQGKVAAIRFAHKYTIDHMGKDTKEANRAKETNKTKAAALASTGTGKVAPIDLKKAHAEYAANPTPEAFVKYQAIKRQAAGKA